MKLTTALLICLGAASAWSLNATAEIGPSVDLDQLSCKDLMAGDDTDREVGLSLYHGYFVAKQQVTHLDLGAMAQHSDRLRDYCLSNPKTPVMQAFSNTAK